MHAPRILALLLLLAWPRLAGAGFFSPGEETLMQEVADKGWIVFASRADQEDWDLFAMWPNGTQLPPLTRTPEWHEILPRVSPDGTRILYRRLARAEPVDNNRHGQQGVLVVARADGSEPRVLGGEGEHAWASWSPDGKTLATLGLKGIAFVDVETGAVLRTVPRGGMFQQLTWSPDGKALSGVSNGFGTSWSVAVMDAATGKARAVSREDCCTPDWFPDGRQVVFSNRRESIRILGGYGWTELWRGDADGNSRLVYAEEGRHVYGGHVSPDGRYALFTGNAQEDGDAANRGAPMQLLRLSDTPMIGGDSPRMLKAHPGAKRGPVIDLPPGWEPCWTAHELPLPVK